MTISHLQLLIWNLTALFVFLWFSGELWSHENDIDLIKMSRYSSASALGPFDIVFEKWNRFCGHSNSVLSRGDQYGVDLVEDRIWSLRKDTFQQKNLVACSSLDRLLDAVKNGKRYWDDEQCLCINEGRSFDRSLQCQLLPSYFLPQGCDIPYLADEDACNILNQFSHVVIHGDSLGRHTAQALMMMLTQDLVLGSFPRATHKNVDLLDRCRCDGQFSEHQLCRAYDQEHLMPNDLRDYGVCTHLAANAVKLYHGLSHTLDEVELSLCSDDSRPILIILNGGTHYQSSAQRTIEEFIDVIYHKLRVIQKSCEWPLRFKFIWTGLNAQSRSLDDFYPAQTRENAQQFNEIVDKYVSSTFGMIPINFFNLTKDAAASDGYHYLSDVNLYKANAILHTASFLVW